MITMTQEQISLWNSTSMALVQAMLGAVSPNFRQVNLCREDDEWILSFFLESDSEEDREEIEHITVQFEAFHDRPVDMKIEITVGSEELSFPEGPGRAVYRRREYS